MCKEGGLQTWTGSSSSVKNNRPKFYKFMVRLFRKATQNISATVNIRKVILIRTVCKHSTGNLRKELKVEINYSIILPSKNSDKISHSQNQIVILTDLKQRIFLFTEIKS